LKNKKKKQKEQNSFSLVNEKIEADLV